MNKKKLIIYDLDGTLVDTAEDIVRAANHMLQEMGAAPLQRSEITSFVGKGVFYLIKGCLKTDNPKQIEKGTKIYRAHYAAHMLDHSRLYPGALEMLDYFRSRKQAVITNKPNPFSRDILKGLGIDHYFTEIVGGDSDYPKKPNPQAVFAILKREKITATETIFIGDSPIDIETARNAGIDVAVVTHGFSASDELQSAHPDVLARDFDELLAAAKKFQW